MISQQGRDLNKGAFWEKRWSATPSCLARGPPLGKLHVLCGPKAGWVLPMSYRVWESLLQHLKLVLTIRHGGQWLEGLGLGSCVLNMCGAREISHAKSSYHLFFPTALELEYSRGTIPARSKAFVQVTARPTRRLHYTWSIKYAICTPTGEMSILRKSFPPNKVDCAVTCRATQIPVYRSCLKKSLH